MMRIYLIPTSCVFIAAKSVELVDLAVHSKGNIHGQMPAQPSTFLTR